MRMHLGDLLRRNGLLARHFLFSGLFAAALLAAVMWAARLERLWEVFCGVSAGGAALAVCAYALSWVFRTARLRLLTTGAGHRFKVRVLFQLYVAAFALNAILPARVGDAAQVLFLHWRDLRVSRAAAIVIHSRVLDAAALLLALLPASGALFLSGQSLAWLAGGLLVGVLFVCLPATVATLEAKTNVVRWVEKLASHRARGLFTLTIQTGRDILAEYRGIVRARRLWFPTLLLSVAVILTEVVTTWTVAWAAGLRLHFVIVLFAGTIATVSKSTGVTPGGIGVYEAAFAGLLKLFGVRFELAVLVAILDHGLKKTFNVLLGLPGLFLQGRVRERPKDKTESIAASGCAARQIQRGKRETAERSNGAVQPTSRRNLPDSGGST